MNESNVDHLLQLIAPRSELVAPANLREGGRAPAFSDQLFRLTAPSPAKDATGPYAPEPVSRDATPEYRAATTHGDATSADPLDDSSPTDEVDDHQDAKATAETPASDDAPSGAAPPAVASEQDQPRDESSRDDDSGKDGEAAAELGSGAAAAAGAASAPPVESVQLTAGVKQSELAADFEAKPARATNDVIGPDAAPAGAELPLEATVGQPVADSSTEPPPDFSADETSVTRSAEASLITETAKAPAGKDSQTHAHGDAPSQRRHAQAGDTSSQANPPNCGDIALAVSPSIEFTSNDSAARSRETSQHEDSDPATQARREPQSKNAPARPQGITIPTAAVLDPSAAAAAPKTLTGEVPTRGSRDERATHAIGERQGPLSAQVDRTNRGQVANGRASDGAGDLSKADVERFVGRVSRAFHFAQERGGTLRLRLSPPELGSLRLELTVHEGVLSANLEAETPAARRLLLDHLPALRDRLAEQHIRVDKFEVDVRSDGQDGRGATGNQQQHQPQHRQHERVHHAPRQPISLPTGHAADAAVPAAAATITDSAINLVA